MILVRPTNRGKLMLLCFIVACLTAFVNVNMATCLLAAFIGGLLLSSFILAFFSLYNLTMERLSSHDAVKGTKVILPVTITNHSNRLRQAVIISERCLFVENNVLNVVVDALAPKETRVVERMAVADRRGLFSLGKIKIIGGDPVGFFAREKEFEFSDEIMIFPECERLSWMPVRIRKQMQFSTEGRSIGVSGLGQDFFGIREYTNSDGMRYIHWKASARHRKLMVKEFEASAVSKVGILLDVDARNVGLEKDNNFEFLVKTVASIADYLSGMYCQLLFMTGSSAEDKILRLEGDAFGMSLRIRNCLANIQPVDMEFKEILDASVETFRSNSILYCLTMSEPENISEYFDMLLDQGVDIRWIYAPLENFAEGPALPFFDNRIDETIEDYYEGIRPFLADQKISISKMLSYG